MALRKPGAQPQNAGAGQEQQGTATGTALAPQNTAVAPQGRVNMQAYAEQSGLVLEGGIGEGGSGNYWKVDGTDFLNKATNETRKELHIIPSYAKKYLFYKDDATGQIYESDMNNRIHPNQKVRARVEWFDWVEGEEEPQKFTITLSPTSVIQFDQYVRKMAEQGIPMNSVWTVMSISRHEDKQKNRYSRVDFHAGEPVQYEDAE